MHSAHQSANGGLVFAFQPIKSVGVCSLAANLLEEGVVHQFLWRGVLVRTLLLVGVKQQGGVQGVEVVDAAGEIRAEAHLAGEV